MSQQTDDAQLLDRVYQAVQQLSQGSAEADQQAAARIDQVSVRRGVAHVTLRDPEAAGQGVGLTVEGQPIGEDETLPRLERMLGAIPGIERVRLHQPEDTTAAYEPRTPLEVELVEDGITPQFDPLTAMDPLSANDSVLDGSMEADTSGAEGHCSASDASAADDSQYHGPIPVLQWELDPNDPTASIGEADETLDGWDYSLWWQHHQADLIYASIQAVRSDTGPDDDPARPRPVEHAVAVNAVYDRQRQAIVAIYGTAQDFRPFAHALTRALNLDEPQPTLSTSNLERSST